MPYVLLPDYTGGLTGTRVPGNVNVALVLGIARFAGTSAVAWRYSRRAAAKTDPGAEAIGPVRRPAHDPRR
ncbi:DUF485 domain-containing protein [Streptomyces sp.]|uniref:DUF485 domain-containing protein n=1 Tax=Streptomyces sp. TaxID=1931 RepID=UPI0039C9E9A8